MRILQHHTQIVNGIRREEKEQHIRKLDHNQSRPQQISASKCLAKITDQDGCAAPRIILGTLEARAVVVV